MVKEMKLGKKQACICCKCKRIIEPTNPFNCPYCGDLPFSIKATYKPNVKVPGLGEMSEGKV